MKIVDIVIAVICGWAANWVVFDFLRGMGIEIGLWRWVFSWVLPVLSIIFVWLAGIVGRKFSFVFQASKNILIGLMATVLDLKIFELLAFIFAFVVAVENILILKGASFLVATFVKYWGNKHWVFENHQRESQGREAGRFFMVTLAGLTIDICAFYILLNQWPYFGLPYILWTKVSVIIAAIFSAFWNFTAYKFFVFKK